MSVLDGDAHGAGGTGDDLGGGISVVGVQVGHLGLADLTSLSHGDRTNLGGVRGAGTLLDASSLLDELSGGRGLEDEREGTVLVDGDLNGDDASALRFGGRVVRLGKLDDVHAVLAQCGADGGCGGGCTGCDLKLDQAGDLLLLCHECGSFY